MASAKSGVMRSVPHRSRSFGQTKIAKCSLALLVTMFVLSGIESYAVLLGLLRARHIVKGKRRPSDLQALLTLKPRQKPST